MHALRYAAGASQNSRCISAEHCDETTLQSPVRLICSSPTKLFGAVVVLRVLNSKTLC